MDTRIIIFWVLGSVLIFLGSLIAGSVDPSALGATTGGVILSYTISFILILLGGMFWISAAMYLTEEEEHRHS